MQLRMTQVTKRYLSPRGAVAALGDVSFTVAQGEFVALVGPSGCGKSTLLRLVAGLLAPDSDMAPRLVVYPCGLVRLADARWLVSFGVHDERALLRVFTRQEIEGLDGTAFLLRTHPAQFCLPTPAPARIGAVGRRCARSAGHRLGGTARSHRKTRLV